VKTLAAWNQGELFSKVKPGNRSFYDCDKSPHNTVLYSAIRRRVVGQFKLTHYLTPDREGKRAGSLGG